MKKQTFKSLMALVAAYTVLQASLPLAQAQSNIVVNGGFEQGSAGWDLSDRCRVYVPPPGTVEGTNAMSVSGAVSQALTTEPGRDYVIQFSYAYGCPQVLWEGSPVGPLTNLYNTGSYWHCVYCYVRAGSNLTRLSFQSSPGGAIDDVKVGWLQEPITIPSQPSSLTVFEGGAANFAVAAQGAPPLTYQWMFNNTPILQGTGPNLTLNQVCPNQAGNYSVLVSNTASQTPSATAALNVQPASSTPVIFTQPESRILPAGYGASFTVRAIGAVPLTYQWRLSDMDISKATNAAYVIDKVQSTDAGTYSVLVSNTLGTTLSLPAILTVTNATGGGWVKVQNNTPIRNSDGVTKLSMSAFVVQVYAGPSPTLMYPVGSRAYFQSNSSAGYFMPYSAQLPDVSAGGSVYVQLRAWETKMGAYYANTYEQARLLGNKFGSSVIQLTTAGSTATVTSVPGFNLRTGLPFFYTGRLAIGDALPDGTPQMILFGQTGFRYLIEKQSPPNNWLPFMVVTNVTGTVIFPRAEPAPDAVEFYRSRMLD